MPTGEPIKYLGYERTVAGITKLRDEALARLAAAEKVIAAAERYYNAWPTRTQPEIAEARSELRHALATYGLPQQRVFDNEADWTPDAELPKTVGGVLGLHKRWKQAEAACDRLSDALLTDKGTITDLRIERDALLAARDDLETSRDEDEATLAAAQRQLHKAYAEGRRWHVRADELETVLAQCQEALRMACHDGWADGEGAMVTYLRDAAAALSETPMTGENRS